MNTPQAGYGAQSYPTRSVQILVGAPAGGPLDIAARIISAWLSGRSGKTFAVENAPGDHANMAARTVVNAAPDGHTLLLCGPVYPINSALFPNLDFNIATDIAAVAGMFRVPLIVEVNPGLSINSVSELIAFAKANPGQLRVAYAGVGTPQHIGIELFKSMAGVELSLVPYSGSAAALGDLLVGKADIMFDPMPSSIEHVRSGRLRPLAVTSPIRSQALPDVPTMSDVLIGFEAGSWFGIGAPKGTPRQIVEWLNDEINLGLEDPQIRERIAEVGGIEMPGPPEAFGEFVEQETAKFARVICDAKIVAL